MDRTTLGDVRLVLLTRGESGPSVQSFLNERSDLLAVSFPHITRAYPAADVCLYMTHTEM